MLLSFAYYSFYVSGDFQLVVSCHFSLYSQLLYFRDVILSSFILSYGLGIMSYGVMSKF